MKPTIEVTFEKAEMTSLHALLRFGIFGSTVEEVVHYLVQRELDDLTRAAMLLTEDQRTQHENTITHTSQ